MSPHPLAPLVVAELSRRGLRIAVAESLTGGLLSSAIVDVPGASAVFSGAVVAYATPVKATLLEVDEHLLAARGPVDAEVARQMARGVRDRLAVEERPADVGLATTGVAGPGAQGGVAPGTVWIGLSTRAGEETRGVTAQGGREGIRRAAVDAALGLLAAHLGIRTEPERE